MPDSPPRRSLIARRPLVIAGAIVWLAALLTYALTAGPGIVELFDDSLEFQLVAPTFGIAHPTGYPLYTLAGGIWSRLLFPFGNWAWRMNLFSSLAAATAVLLMFLSAAQLAATDSRRHDVWAGLAAAAAFGLGPVWWSQATIAEVYALHGFFLAAIVWLVVELDRATQPSPKLGASWKVSPSNPVMVRQVLLLCLLIGLALTHHRMTVLALPALLVYLVWRIPGLWRPQRQWLMWAAALLLPLALYAYIPVRAAMGVRDLNGSYLNTVQGFFDHVLARQYAGFFAQNDLGAPFTLRDFAILNWRQTGLIGLGLGVLGLARLWDVRSRALSPAWVFVSLLLLTSALFALSYQVADREVFFIPVFLAFSLLIGGAVGTVRQMRIMPARGAIFVQAGLALLVAAGVYGRGPAVNRRADWNAHHYAVLMATVPFPPGSRVIGLEGEMTAIKFMQAAEGLAQDVLPITADDPARRAAAIAESVAQGYATFITRELPGIEEEYSFASDGPLVRVWPRGGSAAAPPSVPLDVELLDGRMRLQGYELRMADLPGGRELELTLGWLPVAPVTETIKVSLRLVDAGDAPILDAQGQPVVADRFPIRQVAPSPSWLPGELIRDVHYLPAPRDAAFVQVVVYDADTVAELARVELSLP